MSQTLFRPEAMQAGQASWLGGIRIGYNPKFSTVAAVALVLAGEWMKNERTCIG